MNLELVGYILLAAFLFGVCRAMWEKDIVVNVLPAPEKQIAPHSLAFPPIVQVGEKSLNELLGFDPDNHEMSFKVVSDPRDNGGFYAVELLNPSKVKKNKSKNKNK